MPRLILIYPSMGRRPDGGFVRSWEWEPLAIGVLGALTPPPWEVRFFDDRVETVDYDAPADLVGISIEAYSAQRAYQIASRFRARGVPVIFGGYHATACPDEALKHGEAVCIGEAEGVWAKVLEDALQGQMAGRYEAPERHDLAGVRVDRSLFKKKGYISVALVESGRGCPFRCDFCSIGAFYSGTYRRRPAQEIVNELKSVPQKYVFLVDDNLTGSPESAAEVFEAITPLNKQWVSQTGMIGLEDEALVAKMAKSGCIGLLIGFESLNQNNLKAMRKGMNRVEHYAKVLDNLRREGIFVYGTFLFGYANDTPELFEQSVRFAIEQRMFIAAFNHLVPFPGTPLYEAIQREGRLKYPKWWLSRDFRFGQVPFDSQPMSADQIEAGCLRARKDFYGITSILKRARDLQCNCATVPRAFRYFSVNHLMHREVSQKRDIPLGFRDD